MSVNNTQVGGTHYATQFQHWDFVHQFQLGYFEGQVTRYVTRHRRKKGLEDLNKALHFVEKMIELHTTSVFSPTHTLPADAYRLSDYVKANNLGEGEAQVMVRMTTWRHVVDLQVTKNLILDLIADYEGGPTPAYASQ
jgi:hypothetical protein